MKKIRLIAIFFAALMVVNGFNFVTYAWDYPLDIDVVYISFNYNTGSYSEDALSIIPGYGGSVIQREWDNGGSTNLKFAYIKSQTNRKIQVQFWHNQNQSQSYNFAIGAAASEGISFGDVPYATVSFPSNNNGYSEIRTYQLNGTVAGSVGKRYVKFAWWCVNEALSMGYTGNHYYYTLLDAPQAPMGIPWTSVLDYACVWASGQTSAENAATNITNSLYTSGFDYETGSGAPRYGGWSSFYLTQFISELGSAYEVNCLDMGKAVTTFGNAVGCDLNLTTFSGTFALNCIDPIGTPAPTNNPFSSPLIGDDCRYGGFGYHAFSQNASNVTWDACLKYDIDSNPDNVSNSNPGCGTTTTGYSWILPCNESESAYIQRLVDDWTSWENCSNRYNCGYFTYERAFAVN
ncbi:MAG: hypothetical protein AB1432_05765 [Bacteroidota bacterium]|jgi:hypothetical protein